VVAVFTLGSTKVTRAVHFYNQSSGEPLMSWCSMQTGITRTIAVSRDSKMLASGSQDSTILLFNIGEQKAVNELLRGHTKVNALYVRDSKYSDV
jgi:WD40 repeat protein